MHAARVGVLSLQGDYARHRAALRRLGVEPCRVTLAEDLRGLDALVLPGGESTTMLRLMAVNGLRAPLERFVAGKPVMGTCAGVILLGRGSDDLPHPSLGVLDIIVERNAYGRQIDSFVAPIEAPEVGGTVEGVFIRAPRIRRVGRGVRVIGTLRRADMTPEPVAVCAGRIVGLCFHPELTPDLRFHRWFLERVAGLELPGAATARVAS